MKINEPKPALPAKKTIALPVHNVGTIRNAGDLARLMLVLDIADARPKAEAEGCLRLRMTSSTTHKGLGVRGW